MSEQEEEKHTTTAPESKQEDTEFDVFMGRRQHESHRSQRRTSRERNSRSRHRSQRRGTTTTRETASQGTVVQLNAQSLRDHQQPREVRKRPRSRSRSSGHRRHRKRRRQSRSPQRKTSRDKSRTFTRNSVGDLAALVKERLTDHTARMDTQDLITTALEDKLKDFITEFKKDLASTQLQLETQAKKYRDEARGANKTTHRVACQAHAVTHMMERAFRMDPPQSPAPRSPTFSDSE